MDIRAIIRAVVPMVFARLVLRQNAIPPRDAIGIMAIARIHTLHFATHHAFPVLTKMNVKPKVVVCTPIKLGATITVGQSAIQLILPHVMKQLVVTGVQGNATLPVRHVVALTVIAMLVLHQLAIPPWDAFGIKATAKIHPLHCAARLHAPPVLTRMNA